MRNYVIQCLAPDDYKHLFWSNTEGWIELSQADVFVGTFDREPNLNLPEDGLWVMLPEVEVPA
jgi:hypothetical protein